MSVVLINCDRPRPTAAGFRGRATEIHTGEAISVTECYVAWEEQDETVAVVKFQLLVQPHISGCDNRDIISRRRVFIRSLIARLRLHGQRFFSVLDGM